MLVLPALSVLAYFWRRRTRSRIAAVAEVGLVAGSLPWAVMLFTPQPATRSIELVPLHDLPSWNVAQVGGNLLVLAAFGFFLPVRVAAVASLPRILACAVLASSGIEVLQWVLAIGRVTSVDDVLMNTAGAVVAAMASRPWWARVPVREIG
ncbi:VanZ family protein [Actinoplanes sp. N902-109]|nr:VanZ family protein [Actinoplanes sp. N902-109]